MNWLPRNWPSDTLRFVDVTRLPVLVFALFALLFGGEMVRRVSAIWMYRVQSTRG